MAAIYGRATEADTLPAACHERQSRPYSNLAFLVNGLGAWNPCRCILSRIEEEV